MSDKIENDAVEKKPEKEFSFIKETIKDKPLNKKKLGMKIGIAVILGLIFGAVASVTYTVGVHHMEDVIYHQNPEQVKIEEEPVAETIVDDGAEEVHIDDENIDSADDDQKEDEAAASEDKNTEEKKEAEDGSEERDEKPVINNINNIVEKVDLTVSDYRRLYSSLYEVAQKSSSCLLAVSGVESDTDWFENTYENSNIGSGIVIANNKKELLLLVDSTLIENVSNIRVSFPDGSTADARVKKSDPNTDLAIIGVRLEDIEEGALDKVTTARLGTSAGTVLMGKNVIAVGSPAGVSGSVSYGIVTSSTQEISVRDSSVHMLTTDMYGSSLASGMLINLDGEVVGVITQDYTNPGAENLIAAYGISDIKSIIERMSNGQDKAYLGIYGVEVTSAERQEFDIPEGAYVTEIELDSPAMECGIQSGDVITMIGTSQILSFSDYKAAMNKAQPGDETVVSVMRFARGEYVEMTFDVTLGTLE